MTSMASTFSLRGVMRLGSLCSTFAVTRFGSNVAVRAVGKPVRSGGAASVKHHGSMRTRESWYFSIVAQDTPQWIRTVTAQLPCSLFAHFYSLHVFFRRVT